jgi:hypothetical protein
VSFSVPILAVILTAFVVGVLDLSRLRDRSLLFLTLGFAFGLFGIGVACALLPFPGDLLAFLPLSMVLVRALWSVKDRLAWKRRGRLQARVAEEEARAGALLQLHDRLDALGEKPSRPVRSFLVAPFCLATLLAGVGFGLEVVLAVGTVASIPPFLRLAKWGIEREEREWIAWEMRKWEWEGELTAGPGATAPAGDPDQESLATPSSPAT